MNSSIDYIMCDSLALSIAHKRTVRDMINGAVKKLEAAALNHRYQDMIRSKSVNDPHD